MPNNICSISSSCVLNHLFISKVRGNNMYQPEDLEFSNTDSSERLRAVLHCKMNKDCTGLDLHNPQASGFSCDLYPHQSSRWVALLVGCSESVRPVLKSQMSLTDWTTAELRLDAAGKLKSASNTQHLAPVTANKQPSSHVWVLLV